MRLMTLCLALLLPSLCLADEVICYNEGKLVYRHHAHNITFIEDTIAFIETSTGVTVITNLDCLIKLK